MNLKQIRKRIDKIDSDIISSLAKRSMCSSEVGKYKKENGLKIYQPDREREVLLEKKKLAKKSKVSSDLVQKIFKLILKDSRKIQKSAR